VGEIKTGSDHAHMASHAPRSPDPFGEAAAIAKAILGVAFKNYHGPVAIGLWNGETVIGGKASPCRIIFRHPGPLRHLVLHQDLVRLGEAHLAGEVDVEGDVEALFSLTEYLQGHMPAWSARLRALWQALRLPAGRATHKACTARAGRAERHNSRASIAHHYDISNAFYHLWLDPEMVYSCAYFRDVEQLLAEAQQDKLDYICRKLRLAPGQTLLDIGCGWGALVCWAACHYGVRAYGITLSEQQYNYAIDHIHKAGLGDRVTVELRDYRELPKDARYDRVVSIGMFEHVGIVNFPLYFETVKRALKPGGLFLNHGISNDTGWQDTSLTRFMNRYVFPDAELARIGDVITAMERAGFEIIDVEGLRRHYTLTLRRWVRALEQHREDAVKMVGEATYRIWRLYMAGSAHFFEYGSTNVYQVLAGSARQPLSTPLRRNDIYNKDTMLNEAKYGITMRGLPWS